RLDSSHYQRQLILILAVGIYWLPFLWDPISPAPVGQHLQVLQHNGIPDIDPRFRPFPNQFLPAGLSANRHINGRLIDTRRAYSLNVWNTVRGPNNTVIPANLPKLQLLEHVFAAIKAFK
ncbi:hypothetical protein QBC38DRAFT_375613, partial [Podospora fimiseda]